MPSDILWRPEFGTSETNLRDYRNMWLRISKNISQAERPVMLCGSFSPGQFEECVEVSYFSKIHYLSLLCDDETLERVSAGGHRGGIRDQMNSLRPIRTGTDGFVIASMSRT
ncbi:MAG: hypothetical protein OTJ97_05905 [SAR202 cluster bacterium]|nr:hypothetical protein [SAR202 cluster bacterium]